MGIRDGDRPFDRVGGIRAAEAALQAYVPTYEPLHSAARDLRIVIGSIDRRLKDLSRDLNDMVLDNEGETRTANRIRERLVELEREKEVLQGSFPEGWDDVRKAYLELEGAERQARRLYRRTVDDAYEPIVNLRKIIAGADALAALEQPIRDLSSVIESDPPDQAMDKIRAVENMFSGIDGASAIKSKLSRARRALKGDEPDLEKARTNHRAALEALAEDLVWRKRAATDLLPGLNAYDEAIKASIGLRQQERLTEKQAEEVAGCLAIHRDISFSF